MPGSATVAVIAVAAPSITAMPRTLFARAVLVHSVWVPGSRRPPRAWPEVSGHGTDPGEVSRWATAQPPQSDGA